MPESQDGNAGHALLSCGLWLHIGFVGAATLGAGLFQWFAGPAPWLPALMLAACGGTLAVAAWRRSLAILERVERAPGIVADARIGPARRRLFQANRTQRQGRGLVTSSAVERNAR
ncbi:MAG: hypothetical protein ACREYB_00755 [Casimicrobiaceae bacterium]